MGQGLFDSVATSLRDSANRLLDSTGGLLPAVVAGLTVLLLTWACASLAGRFVRRYGDHVNNATRRNLGQQVVYFLIWAIGGFVALDVMGVDVQSMATGLGLGGVAIGFALKDILSNLVSGLLIQVLHTFEIGDQIIVGETEGTVERIEVRATHIRTYDGRLVLVPNGDVFNSRVTNNTASQLRRASVDVYLDYRQDLGRALSIILDAMVRVPGVSDNPPASMRLRDLTPERLHIEARFWTDSRRRDFMTTASAVRVAIVGALEQQGITLPRPDDRLVTLVGTPGIDRQESAT